MRVLPALAVVPTLLLSAQMSFAIEPPAGVNLPINSKARAAATNRATVRVPGVDANQATRIRAGAHFDATKLKLNTKTQQRTAVGVDGVGNVRVDGSTQAALEAQRRRENRNPQGPGSVDQPPQEGAPSEQPQQDAPSAPNGEQQPRSQQQTLLLRTNAQFRHRLAEIEQMRDVAVQRGDVQLLQHADRLEHDLRLRQRATAQAAQRTAAEGQAQFQAQSQADINSNLRPVQAEQQFQSTLQSGYELNGAVNGQLNAAAQNALRQQQQLQMQTQTQLQNGSRAGGRLIQQNQAEAELRLQQGVRAGVQASQQAQYEAWLRGQQTFGTATQAGAENRNRLEGAAGQTQTRTRTEAEAAARNGQRQLGNQATTGTRTATRLQGQAPSTNGSVQGSASGRVGVQAAPPAVQAQQRSQTNGQIQQGSGSN